MQGNGRCDPECNNADCYHDGFNAETETFGDCAAREAEAECVLLMRAAKVELCWWRLTWRRPRSAARQKLCGRTGNWRTLWLRSGRARDGVEGELKACGVCVGSKGIANGSRGLIVDRNAEDVKSAERPHPPLVSRKAML